MKAYLMYPERDLDIEPPFPPNAEDLTQDLELATLLDAMAGDDDYLRARAMKCLLAGAAEPELILYRQDALRDCLAHPSVVRKLYHLAVEAGESKRKAQVMWFRDSPEALLHKSLRVLELLADVLERLRELADAHASAFESQAFRRLFATVNAELSEEYLKVVDRYLRDLKFSRGVLMSAELGRGNRGTGYVLRKPSERGLVARLTGVKPTSYSFSLPSRDENGYRTLSELKAKGLSLVASAVAESLDHILSFFASLRAELAFYVASLNLYEQLLERHLPVCFPDPLEAEQLSFLATRLYDVALPFHLEGGTVVGNTVDANGKALVMITGANQGGKSTFLRSVGLAQLMMQAGMFVGAESLSASVCAGVFTHYKREEDATMESGKLDEELARMSVIADAIAPNSLLLCNESFASTNEREGSEIARQVIRALLESCVRVFSVTHLFDLADGFHAEGRSDALFLRAERRPDGRRTFRVIPGPPLPTSFGEDSFRRVFGAPAGTGVPRRL